MSNGVAGGKNSIIFLYFHCFPHNSLLSAQHDNLIRCVLLPWLWIVQNSARHCSWLRYTFYYAQNMHSTYTKVFRLNGNSEIGAHMWTWISNLSCLRHLLWSTAFANLKSFTCFPEQVRTTFWGTVCPSSYRKYIRQITQPYPIQIRKIAVQICGNFWVTQYHLIPGRTPSSRIIPLGSTRFRLWL